MLKVTYGQLRNDNFKRGLTKVANCSQFKSPKLLYNIAKISAKIQDESKLADDIYQKLINEYAEKDENGALKPHNGQVGTFFIPDAAVEVWTTKINEFHAVAIEIDRPAMALDDLLPAQLTPLELSALEPLISFDETPVAVTKLASV